MSHDVTSRRPETPPPQGRPAQRREGADLVAGKLPWPLTVPATIAVLFLLLPLLGLLLRAPWRGLPRILVDPQTLVALRLSLVCATSATVISLVIGVQLAWVLARGR